MLRQRKRHGCNVHMYYGRTKGHGHLEQDEFRDSSPRIEFSLRFGISGVRGKMFRAVFQWTSNTVSHNTVMVDRAVKANTDYAGIP